MDTLSGKISWFGGPNDPSAGGTPASGIPITTPGIAVYNRQTLGGWWKVTAPNGRSAIVQQTDLGPAPWTGRKIDFTFSALPLFGYTEKNFPTDATATAQYLGKKRPGDINTPTAAPTPSAPSSGPGGSDLFGSHHSELLYATVWLGALIAGAWLLYTGLDRSTHGTVTRTVKGAAKTATVIGAE